MTNFAFFTGASSRRGLLLAAALGLGLATAGSAQQAGGLDATFGTGGIVTTTFTAAPTSDQANAVALQPDGKLVVAGSGGAGFELVRYLPNGALDATFGTNGKVTTDFGPSPPSGNYPSGNASPSRALAVVVQPDGKIIAAGSRGVEYAVARYLPTGALDPAFATGGKYTLYPGGYGSRVQAVALQANGNIVLFGITAGIVFFIADIKQLTPNGTPIPSPGGFGGRIGWSSYDEAYATGGYVDGNDRMVAVGWARCTTGNCGPVPSGPVAGLFRNTAAGSPDAGFGTNGQVTLPFGYETYGLAVTGLPNGQIVMGGYVRTVAGGAPFLARYNANGTLDSGFGTNGVQTFATPMWSGPFAPVGFAVRAQADGKLVVAGRSPSGEFAVARFNSNGAPDAAFGTAGVTTVPLVGTTGRLNDLVLQPDGKIVAVGTSTAGTQSQFAVIRLLSPLISSVATAAEHGAGPQLRAYPNPGAGPFLTVSASGLKGRVAAVQLLNTLGQVVRAETLPVANAALSHPLPVQGLPPGMYLLQLRTEADAVTGVGGCSSRRVPPMATPPASPAAAPSALR